MLIGASPAYAAEVTVVRVPCSSAALSAAIAAANATGATTVLRLARNCTYDITTPATMADGLPIITGDIELAGGPGTTIQRNPGAANFRVLEVAAGAELRVTGIFILNGSSTGVGGGILNGGMLDLDQSTLSGNTATNGGALANSAGATARVSRSRLTANSTGSVGGGAVINFGTLIVTESVISANTAPINGGGVNVQPGGTAELVRSTVDRNTSGSLGGGISNLGNTVLIRSLVTHNRGSGGGGIATGNSNVLLDRTVVRDNIPDNCSPVNTIPGCVG
jgi:hypothetical protein